VSEMIPSDADNSVAALIQAVDRLGGALDTMATRLEASDRKIDESNDAVANLAESIKRSKRQLIALAVSVALDIILSIAVVFFGVKVFSTSNDAKAAADLAQAVAKANADNAYNTCLSANETRLLNGQLWDFTIGVSSNQPDKPPPTDAQTTLIKTILDQVHKTFAPRDCGADPTPGTVNGGLPPASTFPTTVPFTPTTAASPPST
jgi:hypothetical protein